VSFEIDPERAGDLRLVRFALSSSALRTSTPPEVSVELDHAAYLQGAADPLALLAAAAHVNTARLGPARSAPSQMSS